jgi:hypothetical protein
MSRNSSHDVDNRCPEQMYEYLEARIEALKGRIAELEFENETLRMYQGSAEFVDTRDHRANVTPKELLN